MLHKTLNARQQRRVTLKLGNVDNVRIECLKEIVIVLQLPQLPDTIQSPPGPPGDEHQVLLAHIVAGSMDFAKPIGKL